VVPCGLRPGEAGLLLNWKVGRAGSLMTPETFAALTLVGGLRAMTPLAPVHLRMRRSGGNLLFSWKRRGRLDADSWEPADIPLGEEAEAYLVEVAVPGEAARTATISLPEWTYVAADIATDFGTPPAELEFTVRQHGQLRGLPASRLFTL
jgi:sulfite reductase beta subunit-like hemoprotein